MPAIGLICPNNDKMTWNACLKKTCPNCLCMPVRKAIYKTHQKTHSFPTVTSLLYCPKKAKLEYTQDYYIYPRQAYYAMRGSLIHEILSNNSEKDEIIEQEFERLVPNTDFILKGKIDRVYKNVLYDYKTMENNGIYSILKNGHKKENIWQINIYKWLIENTIKIKEIKIIYLSMSGQYISGESFPLKSKSQSVTMITLPAVPIYSNEKIEAYIISKMKRIQDRDIPQANASNAWLCDWCAFKDSCHADIAKTNINITPSIPLKNDIDNLLK